MNVAVALWSLVVAPGEEPEVVVPVSDLRVTNVALGDTLEDSEGRSTLKLSHLSLAADSEDEDETKEDNSNLSSVVITSLTPGKIEQTTVDITLLEGQEYILEVVGKNSIHLTGNYIMGRDDTDDLSALDSDEEDAYDLREVSSDVEVDPAELDSDASRFEEADEEEPKESAKPAKRPRDSDAMDTDETKLSKAEKKKIKKLKAENGEAVAAGTEQKSEEKSGDAEKKDKKKKDKKTKAASEHQKSDAKELPGGLKVRDAKVGTGPMAKAGNRLKMRYIGKLQDGKIFDQNTKGTPFSFRLGAGEVIKGWDQGLVGMQVGGERVLVVPPQLGYGKKGSGQAIPPNSTLTFECKLLEIK